MHCRPFKRAKDSGESDPSPIPLDLPISPITLVVGPYTPLPQRFIMTEITKWAPDFELPPSEVSPCKSNVKSDKIKLVGYIGLGLAGGPMAENIPKCKSSFTRGTAR
jgi:hypothetical protein